MRESGRHIQELDGVRGLAVLSVLLFHFIGPIARAWPQLFLLRVVESGWAGVDLFFVLSGFLITSILLRTWGDENYFRNFYARRVLRIVPVYVLVVGSFFWIILPLAHAEGKILGIRPLEQVWYWTFLENWRVALSYNDGAELSHLWSVAIEEQFYLVWSVLVWAVGPRRFAPVTASLLLVSFAFRMLLWHHGVSTPLIDRATCTRLDCLLAGSLVAASQSVRTTAAGLAWPLLLVGYVCLLVTPIGYRPILYFVTAVMFACLIARASGGDIPALRWGPLRSFGKYSYAIYMFHYPILGLLLHLENHFRPPAYAVLVVLLGTSSSYGLAWLSWRLVERPALSLKRYFQASVTS